LHTAPLLFVGLADLVGSSDRLTQETGHTLASITLRDAPRLRRSPALSTIAFPRFSLIVPTARLIA
jgi:hypothetical protein